MKDESRKTTENEEHLRMRIAAGCAQLDDYMNLADLLRSDGRDAHAIPVYQLALGLQLTKMERAAVLTELATLVAAEKGEHGRARQLARDAMALVEQEPESPESVLIKGLSLFRIAAVTWEDDEIEARRLAHEALHILTGAIQAGGDATSTVNAQFAAAWLHSALGNQEEAIDLYQACLRYAPRGRDRPEILVMLAEAYRTCGRLRDAVNAAETALRSVDAASPQVAGIFVTLGLTQRAAHESSARHSFRRALHVAMQHNSLRHDVDMLRTIHGNLGEIEHEGGDFEAARKSFQQALSNTPEDGPVRHRLLILLGDCQRALGNRTSARLYYEEVANSPAAAENERQDAREGLDMLDTRPG